MPPQRPTSLSTRATSAWTRHSYDKRLEFLRAVGDRNGERPLRNRFEHRVEGAQGDVEVVYYPRRDGSDLPPDQLSLFILGEWDKSIPAALAEKD